MNHSEKAVYYFNQGYNCAQATATAFATDYGYDEATVIKAMAGFGAGMGGLRETCGAVSAMVYVAGLHAGAYAPDNHLAKTALYELVRKMVEEFSTLHGTTCCRELLKKANSLPTATPSERTAAYYAQRPCARLVASAAEIIERTLQNVNTTDVRKKP
jgi:C_GCAxxG_C_C family probable redox protein